jgi:uncharacterized SAM-binding protein YcdF (DUF218 family)
MVGRIFCLQGGKLALFCENLVMIPAKVGVAQTQGGVKLVIYVIKFIYTNFLFPPGILVALAVGLSIWAWRQNKGIGKTLALFTLLFYLSACPLLGDFAIRSLEQQYRPPANPQGDVIVMLGGGATLDTPNVHGLGHLSGYAANRLLTAAQLYRLLGVPVIVSGGKVFKTTGREAEIAKRILIGLGVPENKILTDDRSLNTTENAKYTKEIMDAHGFSRPILVTSAFHMKRAVLQFEKYHMNVIPYPTDYQTNVKATFRQYLLWPSASAMENISLAMKEYLGIMAVRWY